MHQPARVMRRTTGLLLPAVLCALLAAGVETVDPPAAPVFWAVAGNGTCGRDLTPDIVDGVERDLGCLSEATCLDRP